MVIPSSWFTWDFTVQQDDRSIASIDLRWGWRERATLTIEGIDYEVYREGLMSGDFILKLDGMVLARAEKPSALFRSFTVNHEGRSYTLEARSPFTRAFVLRNQNREVGSICPAGLFTRRADADLPEDIPLAVRVFMIWLVIILWKRQADSSSAAAP